MSLILCAILIGGLATFVLLSPYGFLAAIVGASLAASALGALTGVYLASGKPAGRPNRIRTRLAMLLRRSSR